MWIATKLGFYSVVTTGPEIMIRARSHRDLANLRTAVRSSGDRGQIRFKILHTPHADYPYRAIVTRRAWKRILVTLGDGIDYPNFKSKVMATPDQAEKYHAYSGLWSALVSLQRRFGPPEWYEYYPKDEEAGRPFGDSFRPTRDQEPLGWLDIPEPTQAQEEL